MLEYNPGPMREIPFQVLNSLLDGPKYGHLVSKEVALRIGKTPHEISGRVTAVLARFTVVGYLSSEATKTGTASLSARTYSITEAGLESLDRQRLLRALP